MSEPSTYLLDGVIDFAEEKNISIEKAASQLADLAKQRIPERNFEQATATVRAKLVRAIKESKKEYFLSRVIMRTRVHAIAWTYYPKYHVFSSPTKIAPLKYNWFSIHWGRPNWKPAIKKSFYFLDDLFFDLDEGKFWMHEPYLDEVKASKQLYNFLVEKDVPTLKGTAFKKTDPKIVADFKKERSMIPEYKIQGCESEKIYSSRPYGSKGWKRRVEVLPDLERWEWQFNLQTASPLIFALAESVFMAAETVTPNAPATSGKFILDRPHLNPLPEERTSPATLLFHPAIVRPIPPQTFPKTREQFLLLLGEKAGMREGSKIISQTATPQFSPDSHPPPLFSCRLNFAPELLS